MASVLCHSRHQLIAGDAPAAYDSFGVFGHFRPLKFSKTLPTTSSGVRSHKTLLGHGPQDQSSGQKPLARAPEMLPCRAKLRFERARERETEEEFTEKFSLGSRL
jgi:hypothetical protein